MPEYSGRGDPKRTMDLLWGTAKPPTRGPKPGLSVPAIVEAAVQIADAEGLDKLSMRSVAQAMGVGTMSLYTYVPGKGELLDVMLDTVHGEDRRGGQADADDDASAGAADRSDPGWRAGLEALARDSWAFFHRHPWVLQISGSRNTFGPNELAGYEAGLRIVDGIGLSGKEMAGVLSLVDDYVRAAARRSVESLQAAQATGTTTDDWWTAREPLLDQVFDVSRYPTATKVAQDGGFEQAEDQDYLVDHARESFEFGLARVLAGVEALVATKARDRS